MLMTCPFPDKADDHRRRSLRRDNKLVVCPAKQALRVLSHILVWPPIRSCLRTVSRHQTGRTVCPWRRGPDLHWRVKTGDIVAEDSTQTTGTEKARLRYLLAQCRMLHAACS